MHLKVKIEKPKDEGQDPKAAADAKESGPRLAYAVVAENGISGPTTVVEDDGKEVDLIVPDKGTLVLTKALPDAVYDRETMSTKPGKWPKKEEPVPPGGAAEAPKSHAEGGGAAHAGAQAHGQTAAPKK